MKRFLGRKDSKCILNLYVCEGVTTLGRGNVHTSGWLRPERTRRHPHITGIRIVIVNEAANYHSTVGDIVDMGWRLKTLYWLKQKACWSMASAIAPKGACLRAFVAAGRVKLLPLDFGRQDNFGGYSAAGLGALLSGVACTLPEMRMSI